MPKGFIIPPVLIIFVIIIFIAGAFWSKTARNQVSNQDSQAETTPFPFISSTPTPKPIHPENAIYLGIYKGFNALFFTNKKNQEYSSKGNRKTDPNIGSLRTDDPNNIGRSSFNFNELQNPKIIFTAPLDIQQINNFKISEDKKTLYISLMLEAKTANQYPGNLENYIYKINLDNLNYTSIWAHDLSPNKYEGAEGAAYVNKISPDNIYLVLSILNCFACSGSEAGLLLLNTQTKNEKYFAMIGNTQFYLDEGVFTYQKLTPFQEPCDKKGPYCSSSGSRTVHKPSGDTFTEKLP